MTPRTIELDPRALEFLKGELQVSPVLGGYLRFLNFELGRAVAIIPTPYRGSPYDFRASIYAYPQDSIRGGLQHVVSVEEALCALSKRYFAVFPNGLFITESFLLRRADPSIVQGLPVSTLLTTKRCSSPPLPNLPTN